MENASKALIIAGSVLISVIIISALVLMFNQISNFKKTEANSEDIQKINEYKKEIENFNKSGLYGSEILSLANLVEDYNKRQSELNGFKATNFLIEYKNMDYPDFPESPCSSKELVQGFTKLESNFNKIKNKEYYGVKVEVLASMTNSKLKDALIKAGENVQNVEETEINNYISEKAKTDLSKYEQMKSAITFKNKKFQKPVMEIDKDGNIVNISVKEQGI